MFEASKIIGLFCHPLGISWLIGCAGIIAWIRHANRWAMRFLVGSWVIITLSGWIPPVAWALRHLESQYPPLVFEDINPHDYHGIIVLGGGILSGKLVATRPHSEWGEGSERLLTAAQWLQQVPQWHVILSGYSGNPRHQGPSESEISAQWLITQGIDPQRITLENKSRNTQENAQQVAQLAITHKRKWLLMTSASHMPRAVRYFQSHGVSITPTPVDYRLPARGPDPWFDLSYGHTLWQLLCHEWAGQMIQIAWRLYHSAR